MEYFDYYEYSETAKDPTNILSKKRLLISILFTMNVEGIF